MSVLVIGGTVLDIQAQPTADDLQRGSSVPGSVVQLAGGVGRNIAEATHHLLVGHLQAAAAAGVLLISVVGRDAAADALLANFAHTGLSTKGLLRSDTASTPCVVALLDRGGEVAASVADVAAPAAELTPAVVQRHAADIGAAQLLVLDANLPAATLGAAAQVAAAAGVPVLFEPVSVPKAHRCVPFLHSLAAITPNANELLAIADAVLQQRGLPPLQRRSAAAGVTGGGVTHDSSSSSSGPQSPQQLLAQLAPAASVVLQQGLSCIVLTMGSMGAAFLTLCNSNNSSSSSSWSGQRAAVHSRATCQHQCPAPTQHHGQQPDRQPLLPWQQRQQQQQDSSLSPAARGLISPHTPSSSAAGCSRQHTQPRGRCCVRAQHIPAARAAVVNLSGAGDTLTGGLAAALVRGCDPLHALAVGVSAARVSVQSNLNVPAPGEGLVYESVEGFAHQLLDKQHVWEFPVQAAL